MKTNPAPGPLGFVREQHAPSQAALGRHRKGWARDSKGFGGGLGALEERALLLLFFLCSYRKFLPARKVRPAIPHFLSISIAFPPPLAPAGALSGR